MTSPRADRIADAALALIAERGLRGLTHRAVDELAGLPLGSTSNLARTRAALLTLALDRLAARESAGFEPLLAAPGVWAAGGAAEARRLLAGLLTGGLAAALADGRALTLARFELALEARRSPEVRERYDALGGGFRELAAGLLAAAGCPQARARAGYLLAWCDGILFHATVGAGQAAPPSEGELAEQVELMLGALLGPSDFRGVGRP